MRKHGYTGTPTYKTWLAMKGRCAGRLSNPAYYLAKGITVCESWMDFANFLADMGERPAGCTLDRIDATKGYGPDNCRWATKSEQMRNKGDNVWLEHQGERRCLSEWSQIVGLDARTLRRRIDLGWPVQDVLRPEKYFRHVRSGNTASANQATKQTRTALTKAAQPLKEAA